MKKPTNNNESIDIIQCYNEMPSTSTLQKVMELSKNTVLEEGDSWYAVAVSWWEEFQASSKANDVPSVQNEPLIDKQLSSKDRNVAVLKPKLEEGVDFVFVSEGSWDVIAHELGYDWEIRREVIYQRSRLQLQIDSYPYVLKVRVARCAIICSLYKCSIHILSYALSRFYSGLVMQLNRAS